MIDYGFVKTIDQYSVFIGATEVFSSLDMEEAIRQADEYIRESTCTVRVMGPRDYYGVRWSVYRIEPKGART